MGSDSLFFVLAAGEVVVGVEGLIQRLAVGPGFVDEVLDAEGLGEGQDLGGAGAVGDGGLGGAVVGEAELLLRAAVAGVGVLCEGGLAVGVVGVGGEAAYLASAVVERDAG